MSKNTIINSSKNFSQTQNPDTANLTKQYFLTQTKYLHHYYLQNTLLDLHIDRKTFDITSLKLYHCYSKNTMQTLQIHETCRLTSILPRRLLAQVFLTCTLLMKHKANSPPMRLLRTKLQTSPPIQLLRTKLQSLSSMQSPSSLIIIIIIVSVFLITVTHHL